MNPKPARIPILAFLLAVACLFSSVLSEASDPTTALTHDALFAPQPRYPYFENANPYPHHHDKEGFDLAKAAFLAECSLLAYVEDKETINEKLARLKPLATRIFDESGTFAYMALLDRMIVIAFRGSETGDQTDYLTDAKIIKKRVGDLGKAHGGFVDALDLVKADLDATLEELDPNREAKLWIAGHSLGGALATLYAIQCEHPVAGVYTIGAPRIGNGKLAKSAESLPLYRIVHDNDIIPRLPTPPFYKHFGSMRFITSSGELITDPALKQKWASHRKGHLQHLEKIYRDYWKKGDFKAIPSDYFADHSPVLYVEKLHRLVEHSKNP